MRAEKAINLPPTKIFATIAGSKGASAKGQGLTAARVDAFNTFDAPGLVNPKLYSAKAGPKGLDLNLPAKSVGVVQLEP